MRIEQHIDIDVPAEQLWQAVGPGFASIGEWASAVPRSVPTDQADGRVCTVAGAPGIDQVVERITDYSDTDRTLTYQAEGLPGFIGEATNHWRIEATGPDTSRASFTASLQVHGPGRLVAPALGLRLRFIGRRTLRELQHLVEHGQPTDRKRRQLQRDGQLAEQLTAAPGGDGGASLLAAVGWNAKLSAVVAGLLLAAGVPFSGPFGVSATLLTAIGVALLAGVGLIRWLLDQPHRLRAVTPAILVADVAWIAAASILIAQPDTPFTTTGKTALGVMTLGVAAVFIAQARGLAHAHGRGASSTNRATTAASDH